MNKRTISRLNRIMKRDCVEFIDTTAQWGKEFVEIKVPRTRNEVLRMYLMKENGKHLNWNDCEDDELKDVTGAQTISGFYSTPKRKLTGLTPEELSVIWDSMGTWNSTSAQHFYNAIWKAIKEKNSA